METRTQEAKLRRPYHSLLRQEQAAGTRRRILDSARRLFRSDGYASTSLEAIASTASVSPKTVEAAFGSKRGLLAALVDPLAAESMNQATVAVIRSASSPRRRLTAVAELCRKVYVTWSAEFELLIGAQAIVPELATAAVQIGKRRRRNQSRLISFLVRHGVLRHGLNAVTAADELWAMTGYELYRILVVECGWTGAKYERWLSRVLAERLLKPEAETNRQSMPLSRRR